MNAETTTQNPTDDDLLAALNAGVEAGAWQVFDPATTTADDLAEPDTFVCWWCGDVEHPVTPGDDDSLWCECGGRLDEQRARL